MKTYNYLVYKDRIKPLAPQKGVSGNINYYECTFEFDSDWEGLAKTAVFVGENVRNAPIALNKCSVPIDVLEKSGEVYIGVYGFTQAGENSQVRISTNLIPFECEEGAYRVGEPGSDIPPLDVWERYQIACNELANAAKGYAEKAEDEKEAAEQAQTAAETAQTAAETAQTAAETAEGNAKGYASDAGKAASRADESAGDADYAMQEARKSEAQAIASANAALTAQAAAETAKNEAVTAEGNAKTAAETAQRAIIAAGMQVENAVQEAEKAKAAADDAKKSATEAKVSADKAGQSENRALLAEGAAQDSAIEAREWGELVRDNIDAAVSAAERAEGSETNAKNSEDKALEYKEEAEQARDDVISRSENLMKKDQDELITGKKIFSNGIKTQSVESDGMPIVVKVDNKYYSFYDNGEFSADKISTMEIISVGDTGGVKLDGEYIATEKYVDNKVNVVTVDTLENIKRISTSPDSELIIDGTEILISPRGAVTIFSGVGSIDFTAPHGQVTVYGKPIASKEYVDEALKDVEGGSITIDDVPTEGSTNAVSSGGVFTAIQNVNKSDTTPVGTRVILPSEFTDAPIELYKNGTKYSVVHNFEQYRYGASLYVDHENGSDNGNGTKENPFKTLKKAMESITTDTNIIVKAKTPFGRGESATGYINEYNVSFYNANESKTPVIISTRQTGLSWTAEDNVFKTTRSNTKNILVKDSKDTTFGWRAMDKASSIDDCKANTGTCFVDGSTVYINTFDGLVPTEDKYMVCIVSGEIIFYPKDNTKLFFDGFAFVGCQGYDGVLFSKTTNGEATATVVLKDCVAGQNQAYNDGATYSGNGFAFDNIKNVMLFNCTAKNCRRDGFNYHWSKSTNATECLAVEVDCVAKNCGLNDSTSNNNLTTAHNAGRCLRVNHYGRNCKGPMMTDVNGCKSLAFGCDISSKSSGYSYTFQLDNIGSAMMVDCKSSTGKATVTDGVLYIDGFDGEIDSTTTVINI